MIHQCFNCHFWHRFHPERGFCKRYPPTFLGQFDKDKIPRLKGGDPQSLPLLTDSQSLAEFPVMPYNEWCGEHKFFEEDE